MPQRLFAGMALTLSECALHCRRSQMCRSHPSPLLSPPEDNAQILSIRYGPHERSGYRSRTVKDGELRPQTSLQMHVNPGQ